MLAVVFDKKLRIEERPKPRLKKDEALVRVALAGICNTDVEIVRGYMGFHGILGHEFVGTVEKCPSDESLIGKRVVGEINAGCGKCEWCAAGMERHCPNRTVLGILGREGAFAQYLALPASNLHVVPDKVHDMSAVFAEPLAACFEILDQIKIKTDTRVAVIGDGKLGALAGAVLATKTNLLAVVGKHDDKLARIRDAFGLKTLTAGDLVPASYDVVVECSGNASGLELASSLVRPRGTIVLKSTFHGHPCIDTSIWVINEISVVGSRCGRFEPALLALKKGLLDPEPLVDAVYKAEEAVNAFAHAQKPGVFKVLLDFA